MSNLIGFLRDAMVSYAEERGQMPDRAWLGTYLGRKLPDWAPERIDKAADEITGTLALQARKLAELQEARRKGMSAEEWFAVDVQECTDDEKRQIVRSTSAALREHTGYETAELTDAAYTVSSRSGIGLKDALRTVAHAAGNAALAWISSDEYTEVLEETIEENAAQEEAQPKKKGFFRQLLEEGAVAGLKVAISAGLTVSEAGEKSESTPVRMLATVAHKVVEEASVFFDVIRGKKKLSEAVTHLKDTAVAAFAGVIEQERSGELGGKMATAVGKAVGYFAGPVGAKVGAAVGTFLAQEVTSETVIKAAKGVAEFGKKVLGAAASTVKKVGGWIKSKIYG